MANTTTTGTTTPARQPNDPVIQQLLDKIQSGGTKKAIAVPNNYKVKRGSKTVQDNVAKPEFRNYMGPLNPSMMQTHEEPNMVGVQYWDGDQLQPAGWDPQDILKLQNQMKDAGILKEKAFQPGWWDQASQQAMEKIMGYANQAGVTKEDVIAHWKQYVPDDDSAGGVVLQLKSPQEIKDTLQATSGKIIGRSLSPAELDTLVSGYQNIDRTTQEQQAAAQQIAKSGGTGNAIEAPSIGGYGEAQLRTQFKGEADWVTANKRMNEFYSILGEGGGASG